MRPVTTQHGDGTPLPEGDQRSGSVCVLDPGPYLDVTIERGTLR